MKSILDDDFAILYMYLYMYYVCIMYVCIMYYVLLLNFILFFNNFNNDKSVTFYFLFEEN